MDINVEEFTSPIEVTVGPEASIDEALKLMEKNQIRHLPVLNNQEVVGIVSERDLLTHFGKGWSGSLKVKDIMNPSILTVSAQDSLGEVAFRLSSEKKGSALVLDEEGKIFGIFTTTDALN